MVLGLWFRRVFFWVVFLHFISSNCRIVTAYCSLTSVQSALPDEKQNPAICCHDNCKTFSEFS